MRLVLEHHPSMTLSPASQTPSVPPAVKGRAEGAPAAILLVHFSPSSSPPPTPVSLSLSPHLSPTSVHSEINSTSSLDPSHSRTQKHNSLTRWTPWFTPHGMFHDYLVARGSSPKPACTWCLVLNQQRWLLFQPHPSCLGTLDRWLQLF